LNSPTSSRSQRIHDSREKTKESSAFKNKVRPVNLFVNMPKPPVRNTSVGFGRTHTRNYQTVQVKAQKPIPKERVSTPKRKMLELVKQRRLEKEKHQRMLHAINPDRYAAQECDDSDSDYY